MGTILIILLVLLLIGSGQVGLYSKNWAIPRAGCWE